MNLSERTEKLHAIRDEIINLKDSPLCDQRIQTNALPVIGEGAHDADIMFIGEAPGKNEAETGKPFCGASGRILDEMLASVDISREDVYITNIVKDRPPQNRDPLPDEIALYAPFLDRQIDIIQPKVVATLGRFAMNYILNRYRSQEMIKPISANHGQLYTVDMSYGPATILPLYHPAATIYNRATREDLENDFKKLKKLVT